MLLLLSNTRPGLCEDAVRVKGPGKQSSAAHNSNQAGTRSVNCCNLPQRPQQPHKSYPVYTIQGVQHGATTASPHIALTMKVEKLFTKGKH